MRRQPAPFWNPYVVGAGLGLVLFASVVLTGGGIGASGGLLRLMGWLEAGLAPAHVDGNAYLAGIAGGSRSLLNHPLVWGGLGVMLGGFASGLLAGRAFPEILKGLAVGNTVRLLMALGGGVVVGYAARLARGCTSGQALSGGMVLSVGSWAFMFSVFGGAYAVAYFVRRLWR